MMMPGIGSDLSVVAMLAVAASAVVLAARLQRRAHASVVKFAPRSWRHGVAPGSALGGVVALAYLTAEDVVVPHVAARPLLFVAAFAVPLALIVLLYATGVLRRRSPNER